MPLFLLIYCLVYGSMHAYCFLKIRAAFPEMGIRAALVVGAFLALMIFGPILVRRLDRAGSFALARGLALVTYTWMAVILWFVVLAAITDLWNLGVWVTARSAPSAKRCALPAKPGFYAIAVVILLALCWSIFEASNVRLKKIMLKSARLAPGSKPLKIVQICDLHLSLTVRKRALKRILKRVREADPDLLVCTGDLLETTLENLRAEARLLAEVDPPLGKFAVTGNHEYYLGLDDALQFFEAAGFSALQGKAVEIGEALLLAGVDDPAGLRRSQPCCTDEDAVLPRKGPRRFTVLLKHQPRVQPSSVGRFDLQLSGHTHGGQIFPFNFVVHFFHSLRPGLHRLPAGSAVYVSRGSGTWGPPLRLFAPPEVTLITIAP